MDSYCLMRVCISYLLFLGKGGRRLSLKPEELSLLDATPSVFTAVITSMALEIFDNVLQPQICLTFSQAYMLSTSTNDFDSYFLGLFLKLNFFHIYRLLEFLEFF